MKLNRILLFYTFVLIFSFTAKAEDEPKPPVFTVNVSNKSPKTGDVVELIFNANIPKGMHMYSTFNKCDIGPLKLEILFDNPKNSYCLLDKPFSKGDKIIMDEVFNCELGEFFDKAEVRQKVRLIDNITIIRGEISGQWCTESLCYNFGGLIPITFEITIKASGDKLSCEGNIKPVIVDTLPLPSKTIDTISEVPNVDSAACETCSYKQNGPNDNVACNIKTFNGQQSETEKDGMWGLFILAFLSGLAGLITPCVFPMIPMTVAFFIKDKKTRRRALLNGAFFGISIIAIYVVIGTLSALAFGADAGSFISTHWLPNILFFLIFVVFAISFFGAFEIILPSGLTNKVDREADKGGLYGIFFMALTLAIVSFSCTGPIVGSVLVQAAGGAFIGPVIAMIGFGLAFALPFTLFAIFPNWLSKLPKSGGWLNSVKVCLGFLELALGLKFLSTADQTYHWHILDREVYLSLWIVIFGLMGIYLLGKLRFAHDSETNIIKTPRLILGIATLSFVVYMIPGLWGAPLKFLSGYLPPMSTQDFDINRSIRESQGIKGNLCNKPSYSDKLFMPHGLNGYYDYDEAVACSKQMKKPLFIDFTGHGCVNCRKMEEKVWSDPRVLKILNEDYVIASLYVDDKTIKLPENNYFTGRFSKKTINTLGKKNTEIEICYFGKSSQPLYCLLDNNEQLLQATVGSEINGKQFNTEEFLKFLERGVENYKKQNPL